SSYVSLISLRIDSPSSSISLSFTDTPTTAIYTLSLHDALPISLREQGSDVRYTEYADAGHNSWDETYSDPQVISWLLSRSRRESTESHASETEPEVMG